MLLLQGLGKVIEHLDEASAYCFALLLWVCLALWQKHEGQSVSRWTALRYRSPRGMPEKECTNTAWHSTLIEGV